MNCVYTILLYSDLWWVGFGLSHELLPGMCKSRRNKKGNKAKDGKKERSMWFFYFFSFVIGLGLLFCLIWNWICVHVLLLFIHCALCNTLLLASCEFVSVVEHFLSTILWQKRKKKVDLSLKLVWREFCFPLEFGEA